MASNPSAPPPSYEEAINSGIYYQVTHSDVPPPYVFDNYASDLPSVETLPPPLAGPSTEGAAAQPGIFVIQPPSAPSSSQAGPIPPKPKTPKPTANPTPNSNSTPASNPTPASRPNQVSQSRNQNARRPLTLDDKEARRGFFHRMYLVLVVQACCILAIGGGIYSNEYLRDKIASDPDTYRGLIIGLMIASIFFTWTMTEIRKKHKPAAIIFMIVFNLILSFAVMALACLTGSIAPLVFYGITAGHGLVVQIFLYQKKIAFTLISGMIFTFVTVAVLFGLSVPIFSSMTACLIGGAVALFFGWWVMILIWCMIDEWQKYNHKPEEYLALQPFMYAGVLYLPFILLGIMFCKFEWSKYK
ncbi:uncharacterized protein LOC117317633 [Pecten maximus]|uniref:uncharacterized protein LOC117317633 n=1 Tax=Pecten maximus TaxID=6579 RepID=UPI001458F8A5|nr:uncharacterized protein LOC117317633 [Pecten maximus]XP_033728390.1 uncharacterized protein LOC117317633 [Pecten maximus]XP_033728398.1 uncharacterized protein LOC117317633 [Pecten maximus]XP_033728407.1 uncharacterized protein LOC117317633 [Pecten maximus]